ncbi:MAG TPA: glycosyltransferase family 9 protein [Caulobacteraceae bacterium]|nr:glycosyltransferase family 9 protein [Caulobacteraceae bacterium]
MKILVIKLGALGDFVLAMAAMKKIREAHAGDRITLLTTPPFAGIAKASGWFDRIDTDGRPRGLIAQARMLLRLRRERYDRVYDLQTSSRSSAYFHFLRPDPPQWSGIAKGCSHPHANPARDSMHTLERQADQLKFAGIWPDAPTEPGTAPAPDLSFLAAERPPAQLPYVMLIPGGSAHRLDKRWPAGRFAQLARELRDRGLEVCIIGGPQETPIAEEIARVAGEVRDLTGKTSFADIAALAGGAERVIGNDTGPLHLAAAASARTIALFSDASDPALCAPRGNVRILRSPSLGELPVGVVLDAALAP